MLSLQEIYTKVKTHLIAQGRRASAPSAIPGYPDDCKYRTLDGLKCAVGCLIPDDVYQPSFEGDTLLDEVDARHRLRTTNPLTECIRSLYGDASLPMLKDLQVLHDRSITWEIEGHLAAGLATIERKYGVQ